VTGATISGPTQLGSAVAEQILRRLPQWFGVEAALLRYAAEAQTLPTFVALSAGAPIGFINLREHNPDTLEINCIAVVPDRHGSGVGTALCSAASNWWVSRGGRMLQVKTIGPTCDDSSYARTRQFYAARGFLQVEEFFQLWPGYPCLLLVLPLTKHAGA
jgi:GNAT superfamily N-acetyltransferase